MKTVAIVGTEATTRINAPWDDTSIDIWAFNESPGIGTQWVKRCNALFQLHQPSVYRSLFNRTFPKYWEWLQQDHGYPIYMQEVDKDVPNSVRYPLEEINKYYLTNLRWPDEEVIQFYTNSLVYAIALALYEGYEKIMIFGIEMKSSTEYQYQRDNFSFWVGIATQHAIVELHSAQSIFDVPLYGYDGQIEYPLEKIESELDEIKKENREAEKVRQEALEKRELAADWDTAHSELMDATMQAGMAAGKLAEAQRYLAREDVSRHEFEQNCALAGLQAKKYLSVMNYESGRMEVYQKFESEKWKDSMEKQLEHAYSAGFESGKELYNRYHMMEMDLLIRSAGGQKAADYVRGE
jgi:hypothetical protein